MFPLIVVDRVDVSTRFDTQTTPRSPSRLSIHGRDIDEPPRIELEGWFGTERFEMNSSVGMRELDEFRHGFFPSVEWDRGSVGVHDETVVGIRVFCAQDELFVHGNAWVGLYLTCWNASVVGHEMQIGMYDRFRSFDGGTVGDIEVAATLVSATFDFSSSKFIDLTYG